MDEARNARLENLLQRLGRLIHAAAKVDYPRDKLEVQVLDGVVPDDRVIVHPGDDVMDGVRIRAR